ncbi:MAG: 23S rRNA (guanosine(2251)-2'-O)-methyltransferase RlmB [Lentimicrobiaceae bacterium]|jgi:23S rRNA (guanosine2251-2'-O)-methyltransferase|nr:23S rRNA (guanosine(2251)-2'-O)-methyltransferase RlmB [Lentimicrobiaceae bacterium]
MKTFEKKEQNQMVFGIHPVLEACKRNKEIDKIFVQSGLRSPQINEICMHARSVGIPLQHVPIEKLNRLTRKNHQGVVAFSSPISYQLIEQLIPMIYEEGRVPFIVVLDRITDVRNFGAIARSAYAAGADALVIPSKGSALINPDAMKASSGALSMINVCRVDYIKNTLDFLKESGLKIVGISEKGDKNIWDCELNMPIALIMGSEEDGISESYLKKVDEHLIIPMPGSIDSLNVSVATGIVCFEVVHQRLNNKVPPVS